jgi:ABC-type phosphate transport system permease subunit
VSFFDDDAPDDSQIAPEDIASAARGCQAIIIMMVIIGLLLCVSFAVYLAT